MPAFHSRLFTPSDLPGLLGLVTDNARARWPGAAQLLNSDVAWRLPGSRGDLRLWYDDDIAGYAWFSLITPSSFDLRTDVGYDSPILLDLLRWLEARRREFKPLVPWLIGLKSMQEWEQALDDDLPLADGKDTILQIGALDSDADRIDFLKANGFTAAEHFGFHMRRSLDTPNSESTLTDGWRVRHVLADDFDARVAVHRDSWHRSYTPVKTVGHWHYVRRGEMRNIVPYISKVDHVINGALGYELAVHSRRMGPLMPEILEAYGDQPRRHDALVRARRVHDLLSGVDPIEDESVIPENSLMREYIGGSCYQY